MDERRPGWREILWVPVYDRVHRRWGHRGVLALAVGMGAAALTLWAWRWLPDLRASATRPSVVEADTTPASDPDGLDGAAVAEATVRPDYPDLRLRFASGHQVETFSTGCPGCGWYYKDRVTGEVFEATAEGVRRTFD